MGVEIRDPAAADESAWRGLWDGYLTFYKVAIPEDVTAHTWARILDPEARVKMRLAVIDGRMAGFAIHHHHDTTWAIDPACYLEDLFVDATIRGKGVGRALIDDLVGICRRNGWSRLYWHTDRDNTRARSLYDSYAEENGTVCYKIGLG
ncbi:GNAT family N-acetyltransferase [Rhizobium halophytocola]|uniref:GNAT superfamily N-acetyltransferase n=1 Tax=Rhizobium halophytocola TaxID=735519 RepID=A0ABS4DZX9_9HYPH|nr:GNAT family N-acetyltransferase [Rhizobium halophytocola]MBP1851251.1 GNAT superfamily N-acetyltransferase [Rhizobium halophytocola]